MYSSVVERCPDKTEVHGSIPCTRTMKALRVIKIILFFTGLIFLFINWQIGLTLLLIAPVLHVIPHGFKRVALVLIGYLFIGGIGILFSNLLLGISWIFAAFVCAVLLRKTI